jgi:hypothetical protein
MIVDGMLFIVRSPKVGEDLTDPELQVLMIAQSVQGHQLTEYEPYHPHVSCLPVNAHAKEHLRRLVRGSAACSS